MGSSNGLSDGFSISSPWTIECENKDLRNTVTLNSSNKSVDLEDVVQLDTCVHLIRKEEIKSSKEPCTITITIPDASTELISQIVVVSEARILELSGSCGEYLSTCTAEYVDDFEDCAVYMADCCVKPLRQLLIKFQKTKHLDSMWLYGINLRLHHNKCVLPAFPSINFQSVNEILKEAKLPISENAEKCKTFLQAYSGSFGHIQPTFKSKGSNPQMLMKILEAEYLNPLGETRKNMSKCISNYVPFLTKDESENKSVPDSSANQNTCGVSSDMQVLKNYIDQRFTELEYKIERFEQTVKELETRQNEKLDLIIAMLNKSNG